MLRGVRALQAAYLSRLGLNGLEFCCYAFTNNQSVNLKTRKKANERHDKRKEERMDDRTKKTQKESNRTARKAFIKNKNKQK